jgi:hypothetical protein
MVGNANYPFGQGQMPSTLDSSSTTTGLGNTSPLVQVNAGSAGAQDMTQTGQPFGMKKGGKVKAAKPTKQHRGDGIAKRGLTKGRLI